jgi:hypothetical protein
MYVIELDAIPREKDKLAQVISDARRMKLRSNVMRIAAGICIVLASCILISAWARAQPAKATAKTPQHLYMPIIAR